MENEGIITEKVRIRNFAGFDKIECSFNDGVTYLYGKNGSGKTRLMQSIVACVKGIAEQTGKYFSNRILCIGKNDVSGDIEWTFQDKRNGGKFVITNHITKSTNKITFKKEDGSDIDDSWLSDFLNISLMSAREFCSLSGIEQSKILGIDTSSFDKNIKEYKAEITILNRMIKEAGKLVEVEPVEIVNIDALKEKKKEIADKLNAKYIKNREHNQTLRDEYEAAKQAEIAREADHEREQDKRRDKIDAADTANVTLVSLGYSGKEVMVWIKSLPQPEKFIPQKIPEPKYIEEMPDGSELTAIESEIEAAHGANQQASAYTDYLKKKEAYDERQKKLDEWKKKVDEEETARSEYMKSHSFGFAGLNTDDTGALQFKGRPITDSYFSRGELEIIVAKLATSLNPIFKTRFIDEFGIFDEENGTKLLNDLVEAGYQPIVAVPGERVSHDNAIVLRDCAVVETEEEEKENLL